jgi:peptide/nickel transport system ATP-binding protein
MAAPLLEIGNLSIHFQTDYGTVKAISKVNVTVGREEIVGLVGESGCGKTTIARAILGVIPSPPGEIEDGIILFDGQDLLQLKTREIEEDIRGRAITMIPQDPFLSLNPVFTIRAQIMELLFWKLGEKAHSAGFLKMMKGAWRYLRPWPPELREDYMAKIMEMFREVQIPAPLMQLNKLPHEISGGQRQRVMIAMALLTNPRLIIADEPTTSLDVTVQAQVIRLLKGLVKRYGTSVLFITHDLGVANEICDRIIVLYAGQEMEMAPTSQFFGNPSHPYTRKLLESLPNARGEIRDIPGEVPNLINPPSGCRFHPRCENVQALCSKDRPPAREMAPGHWVRCYHPVFPGEGRRTH